MVGEFRYGLGVATPTSTSRRATTRRSSGSPARPVSGPIIGNAGTFPIHRDQTDHQFVYNLTVQVFRNHSFKTGTDIRRQQLDDFADNNSRGFWNFNRVCGGVTYATPYDAFLDGCVDNFTDGLRAVLPREPDQRGQHLRRGQLAVTDADAESRLPLRVRRGAEREARTASTTSSAPTATTSSRGSGVRVRADAGDWACSRRSPAGRAAMLDPRRLRHLRRPHLPVGVLAERRERALQSAERAASGHLTTLPGHPECLGSHLGLRVRAGAADGASSLTLADPDLEMPSTHSGASRRAAAAVELDPAGQLPRQPSGMRLKYALDNLPLSPLDGPVTVVDHPNNAPAAGFPDLRGKVINAIAADVRCAGTGFRASPSTPPVRSRYQSPTTRSACACRGPTNAGRTRATPRIW